MSIKSIYTKYKQPLVYLVFGGLTTVVNLLIYFLFAKLLNLDEVISNILAWIISVAFAYITNKIYVFKSPARTKKEILKEAGSFVSFRLLSGILDTGLFALAVKVFLWNDTIVKLALQVIVIILNYIFSKLFVFKNPTHT
ncbi:membrane protein [Clostridia bacterium]|nr:membrane protein [Clostridia bacterium]